MQTSPGHGHMQPGCYQSAVMSVAPRFGFGVGRLLSRTAPGDHSACMRIKERERGSTLFFLTPSDPTITTDLTSAKNTQQPVTPQRPPQWPCSSSPAEDRPLAPLLPLPRPRRAARRLCENPSLPSWALWKPSLSLFPRAFSSLSVPSLRAVRPRALGRRSSGLRMMSLKRRPTRGDESPPDNTHPT